MQNPIYKSWLFLWIYLLGEFENHISNVIILTYSLDLEHIDTIFDIDIDIVQHHRSKVKRAQNQLLSIRSSKPCLAS